VDRLDGDHDGGDARHAPASRALGHAYRVATLALAAIGALVFWQGRTLVYYTPYGPGPSFFPLWLGGLLVVLGLGLFAGSIRALPHLSGTLLPPPGARRDVAATLAAIIAFALLIERIGFALTVTPMILVLLRLRGCRWGLSLALALALGVGVGHVFANRLGVALPRAPGDLLLFIGL
jgi:hypothetical protein